MYWIEFCVLILVLGIVDNFSISYGKDFDFMIIGRVFYLVIIFYFKECLGKRMIFCIICEVIGLLFMCEGIGNVWFVEVYIFKIRWFIGSL